MTAPARPRKAPTFAARGCAWCGATFTPAASRQRRCEPCSALTPAEAGRCPGCDSLVSGRARWGDAWGGECDRAEERAQRVEEALRA